MTLKKAILLLTSLVISVSTYALQCEFMDAKFGDQHVISATLQHPWRSLPTFKVSGYAPQSGYYVRTEPLFSFGMNVLMTPTNDTWVGLKEKNVNGHYKWYIPGNLSDIDFGINPVFNFNQGWYNHTNGSAAGIRVSIIDNSGRVLCSDAMSWIHYNGNSGSSLVDATIRFDDGNLNSKAQAYLACGNDRCIEKGYTDRNKSNSCSVKCPTSGELFFECSNYSENRELNDIRLYRNGVSQSTVKNRDWIPVNGDKIEVECEYTD